MGERQLGDRIWYGIPDVLGSHRSRYASKTTLVAGRGASAFNTLIDLAKLAREEPATRIVWTVRGKLGSNIFGGGEADQLPERGALGQWVQQLVAAGTVRVYEAAGVTKLEERDGRIDVFAGERELAAVDEIVVTTGFRPDLSFLSELRLGLDPALEAPVALAPLIDPNEHSCGTVRPHGAVELSHPEPDFYIAGMKSYGRAPTFLLMTGYEQVRSIAAALVGDWEAASEVHLDLPQTGVCCTTVEAADVPCCPPDLAEATPVAVFANREESGWRRPEPELVTAGSGCCGSGC